MHAHPTALVAFSLVHQVPDTRLFHQARHVCGEAGFAPYELPGSEALGNRVADTFEQGYRLRDPGKPRRGHRRATLQEAFRRFETLEFTAKTLIKAQAAGRRGPLS